LGDKICGQKTDTATQIDDPAALQFLSLKKAINGGKMLIDACNLDLTMFLRQRCPSAFCAGLKKEQIREP